MAKTKTKMSTEIQQLISSIKIMKQKKNICFPLNETGVITTGKEIKELTILSFCVMTY